MGQPLETASILIISEENGKHDLIFDGLLDRVMPEQTDFTGSTRGFSVTRVIDRQTRGTGAARVGYSSAEPSLDIERWILVIHLFLHKNPLANISFTRTG
jgi:hypothetical protein